MVARTFQTFCKIIMTLALVSASGCMCMGAGKLMDRLSQSHEADHGMCGGGMMKHNTMNHPATTQATSPVSIDADRARSSHELHGS